MMPWTGMDMVEWSSEVGYQIYFTGRMNRI